MKWGDAHDGYGEHFFDYNHGPSKHAPVHGGYKPEPPKYEPPHFKAGPGPVITGPAIA